MIKLSQILHQVDFVVLVMWLYMATCGEKHVWFLIKHFRRDLQYEKVYTEIIQNILWLQGIICIVNIVIQQTWKSYFLFFIKFLSNDIKLMTWGGRKLYIEELQNLH